MNLALTFARRYLVSKKSSNAINIISWVSVLGMLVGTFGLILILSVFNGFRGLVISLYNSFNPDFTITATTGKSFIADTLALQELKSLPGITGVSEVIEENALLTYNEKQYIVKIKGVDARYGQITGIDSSMSIGDFILRDEKEEFAILGGGIAQSLNVNYADPFGFISIYVPKKIKGPLTNPTDAFHRELIRPGGNFAISAEFDSKYVFVPIETARRLTGYTREISALEISLEQGANERNVQSRIEALFSSGFKVKNRFQQNETLYKVMSTEKWAVYAILTLILVIAAFNIIGSLSMLVIEKKDDIAVLKTMGADNRLIHRIFLIEGILLSFIGCVAGSLIAVIIILAQQHFSLLKIGGGSFVIDAYPVELNPGDFLLVFATVLVIGVLAAWFPAYRASKSPMQISNR